MAAQELGALEQVLLGGLEEAAIARLQLGARLEVAHERVPRVVELGGEVGGGDQLGELLLDDRLEERVLAREAAEDRCVADAGAARDLRHPDVEALLGERQGRRLEDEAAVALGVRAQRALPDLGHAAQPTPPP